MPNQDWFRNETWSDEIAKLFFEKLKRARSKDQYLRIQAYHLVETEPRISLELIERFFALPGPYDEASAYLTRAQAYQKLGEVASAVQAYRDALRVEELKPQIQTNAWLDYALLVAVSKSSPLYAEAEELVRQRWDKAVFATQHFQQSAVLALIAHERGEVESARVFAQKALGAASRTHSGLSRHPKVGLLGDRLPEIKSTLEGIVSEEDDPAATGLFRRVADRLRQARKRVLKTTPRPPRT